MNLRSKVDGQPAYVLHTYPFRETSLIVEVFSRDFGRMALLARGARRPRAAVSHVLFPITRHASTNHGPAMSKKQRAPRDPAPQPPRNASLPAAEPSTKRPGSAAWLSLIAATVILLAAGAWAWRR